MSFALHLDFFANGELSPVDEGTIRAAFRLTFEEDRNLSCWRVTYAPEPGASYRICYHRGDADPSKFTGLTVERPYDHPPLWKSLFAIMQLGNAVLYWYDGLGGALVLSSDVIRHLPSPFLFEGADVDVIDCPGDIPMAIRGRRFFYLRRQLAGSDRIKEAQVRARTEMSELGWMPGYSGQATAELLRFDGKFRTDSLVLAFEEAINQKEMRVGFDELSPEERIVLTAAGFEREINAGGYGQFFSNSTVEFVPMIVATLNRIGCRQEAAITQRAINALGLGPSPSPDAVADAMEEDDTARDQKLQACDQEYFENAGDLAEPLLEFIKANQHKVGLP